LWWVFFWDRVLWSICPGWLQISILLIFVSWVARITGISYRCLTKAFLKIFSFQSHVFRD
jgi:hypothetical protein